MREQLSMMWKWGEQGAAFAVAALFVALLAGFFVPTYDGTDENGYMLTGKRLATAGDAAKRTSDPYEFISGNWVEAREGVYYAKYPVGYPALVALAYRWGGPDATFWVNPVLATLAVLGIFYLGRVMLNPTAGLFAAILLATNPLQAHFGLSALSHTGSLCFAIWAMYFTWQWWQRGGRMNAVLSGALTGYAVSIRYTEALLVLPVVAAVISRVRADRRALGDWGWMTAAGLVALTPLIAQHWIAYGSPFVTGYALCKEATGFGWKWLQDNWWLMLQRMDGGGLFLLFPLGIAGLVVLLVRDRARGIFLALWAVPSLLLYAAYYWAPQGEGPGYVRFFVSVFPPLILGALALLYAAGQNHRWQHVAVGVFVLLVATTNWRETMRQLNRRADRAIFSRATSEMVTQYVPADAVIFAADGMLNYVEYWGDFRLYAQETFERGALANKLKVLATDEPHPFQRQKAQRIANLLGDKKDGQLVELQRDLIREHLAAGRAVMLLTNRDGMRRWRGRVGEWYRLESVAEWVQFTYTPKEEVRQTGWALYQLHPRELAAPAGDIAAVEEQVDSTQYRLQQLREQHNEQFPGGQQSWTRVTDTEKELRELQEQLKKLKARVRLPAAATQSAAQPLTATGKGKAL